MVDSPFFTTQTKEQEWEVYLNQPFAVATGLESWRRGDTIHMQTPYEALQQIRTATPHPLHKDYSSIEMAKRKKADAEQQDKQKKVMRVRIHGVEQRAPWVPPDEYLPFQRAIPKMSHFTKPLRLKIPKGMY
jgi:signal-transduction protein with cAMP-binding, CBS, and nucleotidyltransferase domain